MTPVVTCALCKYVVWSSVAPPKCKRIMMRPENQYTPCSIARSNELLCGSKGRFYEEIKVEKKDN